MKWEKLNSISITMRMPVNQVMLNQGLPNKAQRRLRYTNIDNQTGIIRKLFGLTHVMMTIMEYSVAVRLVRRSVVSLLVSV